MGSYSGKTCRLITMMVLTSSFFLAEIITGYTTHSVALIADSFHMLSDIISLNVGLIAVKMSSRTTPKNTYGWQRAEVVGALVNSVFLMALSFTIVVEAIQRFIVLEEIQDPDLILIVGCIGLVVNLVGLVLFSSHGMSHGHSHGGGGHGHSHGRGGHGHSHGGGGHGHSNGGGRHGHSHSKKTKPKYPHLTQTHSDLEKAFQESTKDNYVDSSVTIQVDSEWRLNDSGIHLALETDVELNKESNHKEQQMGTAAQLNMRGVFLHVLGDALGSVAVIISALIIKFVSSSWRFYIDPVLSLLIVIIIISTTIPLFKQSSMILLQSIPGDVNIFDIENRLISKINGIESIHEFHIWQLSGDKNIATAHIRFRSIHDYMQAAKEIKSLLHDEGIHSTTIQPEFSDSPWQNNPDSISADQLSTCMLMCQTGNCRAMTCCGGGKEKKPDKSPKENHKSIYQIETQTADSELELMIPAYGLETLV